MPTEGNQHPEDIRELLARSQAEELTAPELEYLANNLTEEELMELPENVRMSICDVIASKLPSSEELAEQLTEHGKAISALYDFEMDEEMKEALKKMQSIISSFQPYHETIADDVAAHPQHAMLYRKYIFDLPETLEKLRALAGDIQKKVSESMISPSDAARLELLSLLAPYMRKAYEAHPARYKKAGQINMTAVIAEAARLARLDGHNIPVLEAEVIVSAGATDSLLPAIPKGPAESFDSEVMQALANFRTRSFPDPILPNTIVSNGVQIILDNCMDLGIGAAKLASIAISQATKINNKNSKTLNLRVSFSTRDYARACGVSIDPQPQDTQEARIKENRRAAKQLENFVHKLQKTGDALMGAKFGWEGRISKGPEKGHFFDYMHWFSRIRATTNTISIEFSQSAMEYLVNMPITYTHPALLKISEKNVNAFAIGYKMLSHYSMRNNVMKGTECVISVKKLLESTNLPRPEDLTGTGKNGKTRSYAYRWETRIKERFEDALDDLANVGLLAANNGNEWYYCKPGEREPLPDAAAMNIRDYETFANLNIHFNISGFEPHSARLEHFIHQKEEVQKQAAQRKAESKNKRKKKAAGT